MGRWGANCYTKQQECARNFLFYSKDLNLCVCVARARARECVCTCVSVRVCGCVPMHVLCLLHCARPSSHSPSVLSSLNRSCQKQRHRQMVGTESCLCKRTLREIFCACWRGRQQCDTVTGLEMQLVFEPPDRYFSHRLYVPSPTLSPTDPVPRGILTLCPGASSCVQGPSARQLPRTCVSLELSSLAATSHELGTSASCTMFISAVGLEHWHKKAVLRCFVNDDLDRRPLGGHVGGKQQRT